MEGVVQWGYVESKKAIIICSEHFDHPIVLDLCESEDTGILQQHPFLDRAYVAQNYNNLSTAIPMPVGVGRIEYNDGSEKFAIKKEDNVPDAWKPKEGVEPGD